MSRLNDERYRDPKYSEFRDIVGAWIRCGGEVSLAARFEVSTSTVERWYRGTSAPHPRLRDQVVAWIHGRTTVWVREDLP